MSQLVLAAVDGVRLEHTWYGDLPEHKCANEGYCQSCDGGLDGCQVCGCDNQGGATTHCPGPLERSGSYNLFASLVYHAGLDYVAGNWIWQEARYGYNKEHHKVYTLVHGGSINRLISYAQNRIANIEAQYEPAWLHRKRDALKLVVSRKPRL